MTVLQNIMAPARGGRAARAAYKAKAHRLIEQFSLTGLERRLPEEISGGQQQRCALARLLITSPDVILLDEPFSALDAQLREKMQAEFIGLLRTFPNSILVTHSRDEAYKLCAEIAVMQNGRIIKRDETRALFLRPDTVAVAEISGCKNISPVKKIAHNAVYAHAWGLCLVTAEPVDESVTHIGIRAHDFLPAAHDGESNVITLDVKLENDEPFEKAVIFTNRDAADKAGQNELWWKFSKYLYHDIPARIRVPPERILLLRQS
jgi:molybdate transport system ATP-binding protein